MCVPFVQSGDNTWVATFTEGQVSVGSVLRVFGATVSAPEGPATATVDVENNTFVIQSLGAGFEWQDGSNSYNITLQ